MITCSSCNHQNPEGSLQCENCYTPLPASTSCPNCGASVQTDATFCGQCGFNLQAENSPTSVPLEETVIGSLPNNISPEGLSLPDEFPVSAGNPQMPVNNPISSPIQSPWDDQEEESQTISQSGGLPVVFPESDFSLEPPETRFVESVPESAPDFSDNDVTLFPAEVPNLDLDLETPAVAPPVREQQPRENKPTTEAIAENQQNEPKTSAPSTPQSFSSAGIPGATQLQIQNASLLHLQSNTNIEISSSLDVVHFGKPNGQIPPDIDVSGFPDSEVVSRVHADIRIEGDTYYLEDTGSSNGTYVNHAPLQKGNRHRLRSGDRIALGKGDLVTFIFQLN